MTDRTPDAASDPRSVYSKMRGTSADAPKAEQLMDAVAVLAPDTDFGYALYQWAQEVTRLVQER